MPTNFVKGDLLDEAATSAGVRAIAFGADVTGAMDTGISVALRQRWPALADALKAHGATGKMQPGDVFAWRDGDLVVYALGLQRGGAKPKISTLERALHAAIARAVDDKVTRVLFPRIGGGKSGLDWQRVKRVLADVGAETHLDLVVFEQFVRKSASGGASADAEASGDAATTETDAGPSQD